MSAWATVCFDTSHTPFRDFDPIDMMWYSVKRVDESGYNESCLPIAPAGGSSSRYFKWAQHLCMCKLKSMYWTTVLVMLTEVITYSSRARMLILICTWYPILHFLISYFFIDPVTRDWLPSGHGTTHCSSITRRASSRRHLCARTQPC